MKKTKKAKVVRKAKIAAKSAPKVLTRASKEKAPRALNVLNIVKPVEAPPAAPAKEDFDIKKTRIRIIGIGGGGSNIVSEISSKVTKASFFAANTDQAALKAMSEKVSVFQFGERFTHGLGTGMDAQVGEDAAKEEKEKIKKILEGQDLVVIVSSLGGGTGSGAAAVFAQISRSLGNLTYGIFTLPFSFEGAKKKEIANGALERVRPYLNALTILPNERVFNVVPKTTPFTKTLSFINKTLSDSLQGLIETIYEPGLINIDFADLRTILSGQGKLAFLNTVDFSKAEASSLESVDEVFNSPLFPYNVEKARGILLNVVGEKDLKLSEVNKILSVLQQKIHKDAKIIFGVSQAGTGKSFKVTILATGCVSKDAAKDEEGSDAPDLPDPKKEAKKKETAARETAKKTVKKPKKTPEKPAPAKQKKAVSGKAKEAGAKRKEEPLPKKELVPVPVKEAQPAEEQKIALQIADKKPDDIVATRKNAIQVKKDMELEEKEMLEKEKIWDIPAFLRKREK